MNSSARTARADSIRAITGWDVDHDKLITFWDLNGTAVKANWGSATIVDANKDGRLTFEEIQAFLQEARRPAQRQ